MARLLVTLAVTVGSWLATPLASAQYHDTFEDEKLGDLPSHWMESDPDENWNAPPAHWRVVAAPDRPGGRALLADQAQGVRKALLHTFGSNVQFDVDVLVVRNSPRPQAQFSLLVRTNSDRDRVELTYNFARREWEIRERTGIRKLSDHKLVNNPSRLLASTESALPLGWNHLEISVVQSTLIAKLNGHDLLTARNVEQLNYGRVGIEVRYADMMFDDVAYSGDGEGRVHDGVKEIGNMHNEIYSDIFKTPDGLLTVKSNQDGTWGVLQSMDDGDTWQFRHGTPLSEHPLNQVAVFDNKHMVNISPIEVTSGQYRYEAIASADGGASWAPAGRLPREPVPAYSEAGKLRTCNQRLLFLIDYARKQGTQLYYSDDEGASWNVGAAFTPASQPDVFKKVRRIESGHVVSCGGDHAALFFRTNRDYHYRSTSEDNGLTWTEPAPVFAMRSSLSDASFEYDPSDKSMYAVWMYELRRDPPGCKTEGQWPRERMVLTRSTDCGVTWSYLMDLDNWEGNDARFNQMVLRVIGNYIWVSADTHVASAPNTCAGAAYMPSADGKPYDWRRLYRIDKRKLQPLPRMPLLLTR